ncbi:sugar phosphate isomerase/epimerase family protein [Niabella insulamsoli]|uniref:sugar phosphate isomerase/epimerase family protein n=1 Tax=Niabella insulamsoli TaxID=3144874 RepID=UPI0031FD27E6
MKYLKLCSLLAIFTCFSAIAQPPVPVLGVCAKLSDAHLVKQAGYQFIQPTVGEVVKPLQPDTSYVIAENISNPEVDIDVINVFIPGSIKTTGPEVDEDRTLDYAKTVFERAHQLKIRLIVFGSGASRMVPEGFSHDTAFEQFVSVSKKLAALAAKYDIVLALESQNKLECNFLNTVAECIKVARAVNHPNFRICVDIYHMMRENEPARVIMDGGPLVYHCDIGEKETRSAPGVAGDDFRPYFKAFQKIGYKGKIALECRFKDMERELPLAMKTIRSQWAEAAKKDK